MRRYWPEREELMKTLRLVAPGTDLYEGLENILRARTGALILVGDSEEVMRIVNGGFRIDVELDPSSLYELAKMDGALVISGDARRILVANAHLTPDPLIPTTETGTRHRTAERAALQTGKLVIAISQRRNVITLYKGDQKYVLREIGTILAKANQALQTLERYKDVYQKALLKLTALECEDQVTLADVSTVIQRAELVARFAAEIELYICELGTEGRLVRMQLEETLADLGEEDELVIRDYIEPLDDRRVEEARALLAKAAAEDLMEPAFVLRVLGYSIGTSPETVVPTRGFRILHKIPRLPMPVIENLIQSFGRLREIMDASTEALDEVEGIGEARAKGIKEGLRRLREETILQRK
ncbi:MAG: DNA integrity scanning protein DisA [Firmicutes bacterium]|nr:DNA integrity scanning protein DisA [Bacillota bacterium]